MNMLKDAKDRWNSPTPPFFKKIAKNAKYIAWGTGIIAAGLTSIATAGVAIPIWVTIGIGAITAMATAASATAGLATEDQTLIDKQYPK